MPDVPVPGPFYNTQSEQNFDGLLDEVRRGYARGEIDREEFERMRRDLS